MATRSILTHQPDVSCDMCGRRLLRGERPDVFLAAGASRTVCELCVPRAAAEGWTRASEALAAASMRTQRPRRSRTLLGRLRQRHGAGAQESLHGDAPGEAPQRDRVKRDTSRHGGIEREAPQREGVERETPQPAVLRSEPEESWQPHTAPEWETARHATAQLEPAYSGAQALAAESHLPADVDLAPCDPAAASVAGSAEDSLAMQAVEIFNASEFASRVAGIARALGEPSVTVLPSTEHEHRVGIVVAWELCWYRYEVDLAELPATIALLADGTELDQLPPADRLANAAADERGELSLLR